MSCRLVVACCLLLTASCLAQQRRRPALRPAATPQQGGGAAAQLAGLSAAARAALDMALGQLERGSLPEAERAAREAVAAAPRSPVPRNLLGVVLDRQGRPEEALAEFNAAIKLDPNFTSAHNNLGRLLAARGQTREAVAEFERVLRTEPGHVQAHFNLGSLYAAAGDFGKAAEHFAQARRAEPEDPQLALAFIGAGYRAHREAEADAAADLFERWAAEDPRALFTLATALAQSGRYERAARLFRRVNELRPHTYEVLYDLGVALYNLDRMDEAARSLAEAADLDPAPAETHFRLGLIASTRGDHANAVAEFKHAVERDARNANYQYLLGREYYRVGYWEGAVAAYTRAIEAAPTQAAYYLARADALYRKDEPAPAAADFDRAAELDPTIENIDYWRGYSRRVAGDFDGARRILEPFAAAHPDHVDALASLGFIATEQGRLEDAEAPLSRALRLDPKNLPVLYDYARVAVKRRDYTEAVARLERVVSLYPAYTQAHYQLFLAYGRLKQAEKAQAALAEFRRLEALEKQLTNERILDDKLRTQRMLGQQPQ